MEFPEGPPYCSASEGSEAYKGFLSLYTYGLILCNATNSNQNCRRVNAFLLMTASATALAQIYWARIHSRQLALKGA
jgi:hypothetical protein